MMNDEFYMRKALQLARRGLGKVSPNPMVGAVIVRDERIIGQGFHRRFGGPHAEVEAIGNAREDITGSTMYVTLEPCCHYKKKTPPCLDLLLQYDLKRVVIGTLDPNPQVNGKSVEVLKQRGIDVNYGVLAEECEKLNEAFFKWIRTGLPFVTLKLAQTLDGKIAAAGGDARWISSTSSLKLTHRLRSINDAVLIGIGTVVIDNPKLTVRNIRGRSPQRIVVDSTLKMPLTADILNEQNTAPTIIAATSAADADKITSLRAKDIEVLMIEKDDEGRAALNDLLKKLGQRNISSVLAEGGSAIATSLIKQNLIDKFIFIIAPKMMGTGVDSIGDLGIGRASEAIRLCIIKMYHSGDDLVIEAKRGK